MEILILCKSQLISQIVILRSEIGDKESKSLSFSIAFVMNFELKLWEGYGRSVESGNENLEDISCISLSLPRSSTQS